MTLLESGIFIAVIGKHLPSWNNSAHDSQGYQLATLSSSQYDLQRRFRVGVDVGRVCRCLSSPSLILGSAIVLRSLLFWFTTRTIHCSWESFETFLPALITLYTTATPTAIQLRQYRCEQSRSRCYFKASSARYVFLAIVWACAARATVAFSTQPAGAICPAGSLRWERQIPLAQALTVLLDALLVTRISRLRQDTMDDAPHAWAFVSRLFLGSAAVLAVLATFSFHHPRNVRWYHIGISDLLVDSTAASLAIISAFYVMSDIHPSTLAMIATASGVYTHQLLRMLQVAAPLDDSLPYMIAGGLTIAGVGLLLRYDKDLAGAQSGDSRLIRFFTGWYVVLVGFLCGTYLVFYPDFNSSDALSFSDLLSVAGAESDAWVAGANQSRNLEGAVGEYHRRYGLAPPPNFDKWFEYAVANGSPIIDDFTQINDDILPFWGVPPDVLRQRTKHMLKIPWLGMGGIRIRGGKVEISPGTPGTHMWMMHSMQDMISEFAEHLPDMDFAINLNDEPRLTIPFEEMQQLQTTAAKARTRQSGNSPRSFDSSQPPVWSNDDTTGSPHERSPYFEDRIRDQIYYDFIAPSCPPDSPARNTRWWNRKEACHKCLLPHGIRVFEGLENPVVSNWTAATDLCHQPDLAYLDGFLLSPAPAIFTKEPFPVFSQSRTSGFHDIVVPSPWNYDDKAPYSQDEDIEWERKKNIMFWRGSSSDGYAARGAWQGFLRARFVQVANAIQSVSKFRQDEQPAFGTPTDEVNFDVGFVGDFTKCHSDDCQSQRDTFWGVGAHSSPKGTVDFAEHWKYAHLMDLDGAGFSGRFIPFLRSRSLVYRAGLFRTWFGERVHAWRHYVPVDARLHELRGLLRYFGTDDEGRRRAREIAEEGRAWAAKALRREDMRVYMFRLLLEWGRVVDDAREELGFSVA
ncbi:hypothetical protein LZ32DRAFT_555930 [Colletotrichum eremochloae]|nr:hypothetical protein LZ32DRAFT_555930 [Colletotrichum eremochloae]